MPDSATIAATVQRASNEDLSDPPRRADRPLVIIAMPSNEAFQRVRRALIKEIAETYDVVTFRVDRNTPLEDFAWQMNRPGAVCAVLMDNPTVNLFRAYENLPNQPHKLPALVVMSSFLEEISSQLRNATGIAYEVPGVTAFVSLRSLVAQPVRRIGVIHRPHFRPFVERQSKLAAQEHFAIVPAVVPADPSTADVRHALGKLKQANVDALWVLNDNRLLRDIEFLTDAWREGVASMKVPVIVGVPTLVGAKSQLGTMAVLPDLDAMGVQAANLLIEIADDGFRAKEHPVELPLSTLTFVDLGELRKLGQLREGAEQLVDHRIE